MPKTALICGISGQDGAYLGKLLLDKGYVVVGTSRDAELNVFHNLLALGIKDQIALESLAPIDFRSILQILKKYCPDEIYNLSGQSSVNLSFQQPVETFESIAVGTLNFLEAIRFLDLPVRFYNAGSSDCFGDTGAAAASESSPFRPRSPYAVAKATAIWQIANYRDAYQIYACSGILSNHESMLRPRRFVTRKITSAACRIAHGSGERLGLGNLDVVRDWGWAPDYVGAIWLMLQQDQPEDFVIATGHSHSLREFVERAFAYVGCDWRDHVQVDEDLFRPTDIPAIRLNPSKALHKLGWQASYQMPDVVDMMMAEERP